MLALKTAVAGVLALMATPPASFGHAVPAPPAVNAVLQSEPDPATGAVVVYIRFLPMRSPLGLPGYGPRAPVVSGATFFIDGVEVATLTPGSCTSVRAPAGSHALIQQWSGGILSDKGNVGAEAAWSAGKSYYYEFSAKEEVGGGFRGWTSTYRWYLLKIGPEAGRARLEGCRFTSPTVKALPGATEASSRTT